MLLELFVIVAPVFLLLGSGYLSARVGWFDHPQIDALMRFAQGFAVPVLLFLAVLRMDLGANFSPALLTAFYAGSIACFALGIALARWCFGRRPGEAVAVGFAALFSNSVLLGLPITERAYGVDALTANFVIVSLHAPVCYLLGTVVMELARADGRPLGETLGAALASLARNPLMIGIALGFVANTAAIPLWEPLRAALEMTGRAALPLALFGLGAVLTRYRLGDRLGESLMVVALSLLVHPALVWWLAGEGLAALSEAQLRSAVVTAAMAPGINAWLFANIYQRAQDTAANAVLLGTALSVFSASAWLWLLGV